MNGNVLYADPLFRWVAISKSRFCNMFGSETLRELIMNSKSRSLHGNNYIQNPKYVAPVSRS